MAVGGDFLLRPGSNLPLFLMATSVMRQPRRRFIEEGLMAIAMQQISPVAHLPLGLGVVRKLNVATLIDTFCPPHPAHILSGGRGGEALLLAILDGHHALYQVGARLEERGMLPLRQPGLTRASLHDYRLGQSLATLFAANLNRV